VDRQPGAGVGAARDGLARLGPALDPVLGREERDEVETGVFRQPVDGRAPLAVEAGVVRDEPDPAALDQMQRVVEQNVDPGSDDVHARGHVRGIGGLMGGARCFDPAIAGAGSQSE
jgi:hypothetical protein